MICALSHALTHSNTLRDSLTHSNTVTDSLTHSHRTPTYSLAQVRLIQRALLGEEARDEALEETKLVTPIKKKEGGRHVHQPVDEGGPNALRSTTARQPTSLVGRTRLLLVAALHSLATIIIRRVVAASTLRLA